MQSTKKTNNHSFAFIGTVGIPNKYGGFESFLEVCTPILIKKGIGVIVTCEKAKYQEDLNDDWKGVKRFFLKTPANGKYSIIHDLFAFLKVFNKSSHIFIMGVSGGIWFPLFRFISFIFNKKIITNIDGIEWRRNKHSKIGKFFLKISDRLAQYFSHAVIYDNEALKDFLIKSSIKKSFCIEYSGDHVKFPKTKIYNTPYALTICRIEPENNIELLIEGFLKSNLQKYIFVGNWNNSQYSLSIKNKYLKESRLELLDPIFDHEKLASLRGFCSVYLHGHSVGGTNPSLVEMLFYDCQIYCFDVSFNRITTKNIVKYFKNSDELADLIINKKTHEKLNDLRSNYTSEKIVSKYISCAEYTSCNER